MHNLILVSVFTTLTVFGWAQSEGSLPVGIGVKGGIPLNDAFLVRSENPVDYVADTHRYTVGPYIELRLPAGFAIEADALYQTFEYHQIFPRFSLDEHSHAWQFPFLAKYRFLPGPIKPYIEAGAAFSHLSVNDVFELSNRNVWGLVVGGGVDFRLGPVHLTPELRYTGWTSRHFDSPGSLIESNRNDAAVMLGIGF